MIAHRRPVPRVLINFASSVDGKINPAPGLRQGKFMMSRHREDFRRMLSLRAEADAVLIGATNLRADNPDLAIPAAERAARRARGAPEPARVVLTTNGVGITPDLRIFDPALGGPVDRHARPARCLPRPAPASAPSPSWPSSPASALAMSDVTRPGSPAAASEPSSAKAAATLRPALRRPRRRRPLSDPGPPHPRRRPRPHPRRRPGLRPGRNPRPEAGVARARRRRAVPALRVRVGVSELSVVQSTMRLIVTPTGRR